MNYTLLKKDPSWCELLRLPRWRKTSKGITDVSVFLRWWNPNKCFCSKETNKAWNWEHTVQWTTSEIIQRKTIPKDREMQRQIGYWSSQFAIYRRPIKTNVKTANWFSTCALEVRRARSCWSLQTKPELFQRLQNYFGAVILRANVCCQGTAWSRQQHGDTPPQQELLEVCHRQAQCCLEWETAQILFFDREQCGASLPCQEARWLAGIGWAEPQSCHSQAPFPWEVLAFKCLEEQQLYLASAQRCKGSRIKESCLNLFTLLHLVHSHWDGHKQCLSIRASNHETVHFGNRPDNTSSFRPYYFIYT